MSYIVKSGQAINACPLNKSPAKAMYSFPRSKRFLSEESSTQKTPFYQVPGALQDRGTLFPKAVRPGLVPANTLTVGPADYSIDGERKRFGISFGVGRDCCYKSFAQPYGKQLQCPGPGYYQPRKYRAKSISIGRARKLSERERSPGPAAYSNRNEFIVSKYKRVRAFIYSKVKGRQKSEESSPELTIAHAYPGRYPLSQYLNSPKAVFFKERRLLAMEQPKHPAPGPGQYQLPSQFGIYNGMERKPISKVNLQGERLQTK